GSSEIGAVGVRAQQRREQGTGGNEPVVQDDAGDPGWSTGVLQAELRGEFRRRGPGGLHRGGHDRKIYRSRRLQDSSGVVGYGSAGSPLGGTPSCARACEVIFWNTGAAIVPPSIPLLGLYITKPKVSTGTSAGALPPPAAETELHGPFGPA